jgi:hypothetical protein
LAKYLASFVDKDDTGKTIAISEFCHLSVSRKNVDLVCFNTLLPVGKISNSQRSRIYHQHVEPADAGFCNNRGDRRSRRHFHISWIPTMEDPFLGPTSDKDT